MGKKPAVMERVSNSWVERETLAHCVVVLVSDQAYGLRGMTQLVYAARTHDAAGKLAAGAHGP